MLDWLDIVGNEIFLRGIGDHSQDEYIHVQRQCSYLKEEILGNSTEQGTGRITSLLPTAGAGMERQMF